MNEEYDIVVDLKMTIHWRTPADSYSEQIDRDMAQNRLDQKAFEFTEIIKDNTFIHSTNPTPTIHSK